MDDREFASLFKAQLLARMTADPALSSVGLANGFPTRQSAIPDAPFVFFNKVSEHRHGSPRRVDTPAIGSGMDHREVQKLEATWQFTAWVPQPTPAAGSGAVLVLSESDILRRLAAIMQSYEVLKAFQAAGVGQMRITDISNPMGQNDRDQFAASPSFSIVLTHDQVTESTQPAVDFYNLRIRRV